MNKTNRPSASNLSVFRQLCNLIPPHLVAKLAKETGAQEKSRTFTPWSHVVALLYAQFTHAIGLNDVCDALRLHCGPLSATRGATPPSRNGLSNASRERPAAFAEQLFWKVHAHLHSIAPRFGHGRRGKGVTHRFRKTIHTTLAGISRADEEPLLLSEGSGADGVFDSVVVDLPRRARPAGCLRQATPLRSGLMRPSVT